MSSGGAERHAVRILGEGRVEVAADGFADAEHLVEKELRRIWDVGTVEIVEVGRPAGSARIVDHFAVSYRLAAEIDVDAGSRAAAAGEAFRKARSILSDSRYGRTEWRLPDPPPSA